MSDNILTGDDVKQLLIVTLVLVATQAGAITETNLLTCSKTFIIMVVILLCLWFHQVKHKLSITFATATGRERDFGTGTTLVNVVDVMVTPYNQMKLVLNRHMLTDRVF